jgi:hypothetical protein
VAHLRTLRIAAHSADRAGASGDAERQNQAETRSGHASSGWIAACHVWRRRRFDTMTRVANLFMSFLAVLTGRSSTGELQRLAARLTGGA